MSGSYNRTDGHRDNMEFEQYGGYAKLGYEMTGNWNLRGDINITHFNASYPGPTTAPLLDGDQRITRGVTSFAIENNYEQTSGGLSFFTIGENIGLTTDILLRKKRNLRMDVSTHGII